MTINELSLVINELIAFGEDKDELLYWLSIYEDLSPDQQAELCRILVEELEQMRAIA